MAAAYFFYEKSCCWLQSYRQYLYLYLDKYYDAESFYARIDKFYGQIVDIIEANDQLEISCKSSFYHSYFW